MSERSFSFPDQYFDNTGIFKIKIDWVWLVIPAILALVYLFDPPQAGKSVILVAENLVAISPYLLVSVLLAAAIKASGADSLIGRAFAGHRTRAIIVAALAGALSPFCSCGVVPLIAALLGAGVPLAPVMAFWLASPVIDPEMFVLTAGVLGMEFALAKTLAAALLGLLGGFAVQAFDGRGIFADPLNGIASTCGTGRIVRAERPVWAFWREPQRRVQFRRESSTVALFLAKWLCLAFLLESLMLGYVPMQTVGAWLAGLGSWAIPAAAAVGVPAYLNGYAAIPFTDALMTLGLQPGAALSFMVAGGVTSIPAAVAVKALVRLPVFLFYLGVAAIGSVSVGFLYAAYLTL